jgi:hypothetical protein
MHSKILAATLQHMCVPGLPDGIFSDKNTYLGKFWRVLELKMFKYFKSFGIFYGHLEYFMAIW